ncbi:MAG TPA: TonB-dependent receptor, partial [Terriglobales bacterium]|nr:TonB-dependent receptor [Terriglobales bacterium]
METGKLRNSRNAKVWLTAFLFVVTALPALSQTTSSILGVVKDPSGAVVPAASITIQNVDTAQARTTSTGNDGAYRVPALQAGHYTVKVEKAGFKTQIEQGIILDIAQELSINPVLQVGTSEQQVSVTGEMSQVNTTSSSMGGLVDENKMSELPLNGRNYIDLSLMQPGVAQNKNNGGLGGMIGTVFSSNGAPTISNNFLLDGTSTVNQSGWGSSSMAGTTLGVEGIKEYKVVTSTFSAEYGMTMGSQMVVVSKSGANRFHGSVFEYLRNSALDARNYFDPAKIPPFKRNNFGASLGGPIRHDKTFFFTTYEGVRQNLGFTVLDQVPAAGCHGPAGRVITNVQCPQLGTTSSVTVNANTAPLLALYPNPTNAANNTFTFPASSITNVDFGQMRIDHNFSDADTLFGRFTIDQSDIDSASSATTSLNAFSGIAFPQTRGAGASRNQFLTLSENHIFSPALLNTARISYSRTNFKIRGVYDASLASAPSFVAGQPIGQFTVGGLTAFGVLNATTPVTHTQNIYAFSDDLYYVKDRHAFKFGTLINYYDSGQLASFRTSGQVAYSNITNFLRGIPSSYNIPTPGSDYDRDFRYKTLGFYAQDDWRATSRLTLNLGLRYEFMTTPKELNGKEYAFRNHQMDTAFTKGPVIENKSYFNFSPRVGFAWDIFGNGKTAMRGGAGIYYDVGNLGEAFTANAGGMLPLASSLTVINTTTNAVIGFPLVYPANASGFTLGTLDYNSNQPHLVNYNLSLERQLPGEVVLSVAYVGSRGAHLWQAREGNPAPPTALVNGVPYWSTLVPACSNVVPTCRANPSLASITLISTTGQSWYNSLQTVVSKRLSKGLQFQASYTWSHSLDATMGQLAGTDCLASGMDTGVDPNYSKSGTDYGPSCFDIRHNLRFNLLYHLPTLQTNSILSKVVNGWWVGNIVSVQTGYPFSPVMPISRSQSSRRTSTPMDRVNLNTATVAPGQTGPDGQVNTTTKTFIPYDAATVITGNPQQWFNPLMFSMPAISACPNNATLSCGTLGNAPRGLLRGPGLGTWDLSVVKDTAVPFLGEAGSVQFRAEFFNVLNRTNFGMPAGNVFSGATTNRSAYSEAPLSSAGQITNTATTARQVQLA